MWRNDEWDGFCMLMEEAWPGDFPEETAKAYRILLNDVQPQECVAAMKRLLYAGARFRPSVAELLAQTRRDPSKPSFPEAFQLIYGPGGILRAEPARNGGPERYKSEADRRHAFDAAAWSRADEFHPLVRAFVTRYGIHRLRALPVEDPQWGRKHQADLQGDWDRHCESWDGREIAALTTGEGMRRFDPLAALGVGVAGEIGA